MFFAAGLDHVAVSGEDAVEVPVEDASTEARRARRPGMLATRRIDGGCSLGRSRGLVGQRWRTIEKPAALAAVAIDLADMISAVEARNRKAWDSDLTGGLAFSAAGIATAGPLLLTQR